MDLRFVADLPFGGSDHVPLVQDDQGDVVEYGRVGAQREVQLLRGRYDDFAGFQGVFVDVAVPMLP
ncbi:hypothetical protein Alo02nite_23910 [Actinoplanes lobatus]|uniref:Uncharacterized protein n=1 Tax=Actinoplanes lobatus TaxID=113568 RepID=A0ABQ4AEU1_9ACTN|nr:hypothetical protein Alo02nite_23910 [Actinoplanes lobatus]